MASRLLSPPPSLASQTSSGALFAKYDREALLAVLCQIQKPTLPKSEEPDIDDIRTTPSAYDLYVKCQETAARMLLLADFDGPVVRGEPQRRQFVASVAALLEHYCSAGSSP